MGCYKNERNKVAFYLKSEFSFSPQDASALGGAVEDDGRQVRIVGRAHEEEDVAPFAPFKLKKQMKVSFCKERVVVQRPMLKGFFTALS